MIKERLVHIQKEYPDLTLDNDGYEYLTKNVLAENASIVEEIEDLIRKADPDIVKFFNFKPRPNGSFALRYNAKWNSNFTGVNYLEIDEIEKSFS